MMEVTVGIDGAGSEAGVGMETEGDNEGWLERQGCVGEGEKAGPHIYASVSPYITIKISILKINH